MLSQVRGCGIREGQRHLGAALPASWGGSRASRGRCVSPAFRARRRAGRAGDCGGLRTVVRGGLLGAPRPLVSRGSLGLWRSPSSADAQELGDPGAGLQRRSGLEVAGGRSFLSPSHTAWEEGGTACGHLIPPGRILGGALRPCRNRRKCRSLAFRLLQTLAVIIASVHLESTGLFL